MKHFSSSKHFFCKPSTIHLVGCVFGVLLFALACRASVIANVNWSSLTADQLSQLSNSAFSSMSALDLSSIPPAACSGFKFSQVAGINENACSGFKAACFSNMLDEPFSGFRAACIRNVQDQELRGINSAQKFSRLTTSVITSLSKSAIHALDVKACAGFTTSQVLALNNESPSLACSGFTSQCFNSIPLESLSGVKSSCVGNLDVTIVNQLSGASIKSLRPSVFAGWTQSQIDQFTNFDICSNFTQNQINALRNDYPVHACNKLQAACLSAMQPNAYGGMTSACVNQLDASQINGISQPEQLANIPALSFAGFSSNQISKLLPKTCSGFKSDQVVKMNNNYPNYACQGFKSECLSNIPAKAFTGFSSACISLVDALQMSGLLSSQLEQLPDAAYSGFTSKQIAQFTPAACAGISSNQVSKLNNGYPNYACQGFKSDCLSNIPDRSYTGFTSTCVTFLEASQVHGISSFQLKQITPNAFSGFTSQQVSNLDPLSCSGITSSQVSSFNNGFPNHACQGITATCLSSISEASYSGFKSVCLSNIPPESMKGIAASQLRNIPFDQIKGLTQAQVATLNNSTCSGFTASQINKLSSSACSGFKYGCLFEMTPLNIVSSLTSQCFSNIPSASASGFKPESIPYFTTDTLTGLQLNQLVTWFNSYGEKYFVSVATQKQLSAVSSGVILKFKEKIENSEIQRKRQLALAQLSSLTWLQLSLSTDDSLKNVLNANTITDITFDQTFYGLLNNVHMLPEDVFSTLKVQSFSFFLSDTVSGITAEQISHIVPKAFNYPNGLTSNVPSINSSSVKGITDQQLDMLLTDDNLAKLFTCTQFRAMTLSQWNYIRHTNSYRQLESKCGSISPGPSSYPPKENPSRPNPVQPSRSHSRLKELRSSGMSVMKYSNASYFALLLMPIIITALVQ